jgi:hypothetical protein
MLDLDKLTTHTGRIFVAGRTGPATPPANGRTEYDCIFTRPGRVLRADGQPSNWLIPARALEEAAPKFNGLPVYLDHPEQFGFGWHQSPRVLNLVGVTFDAEWSNLDKAVVGKIRLYDATPGMPAVALVKTLFDQILQDDEAGRETPPTGLSAVFYHKAAFNEEEGLKVTESIDHVESMDVVYSPGAGGYIREALAAIPVPRPLAGSIPQPIGGTMPPEETPPTAEELSPAPSENVLLARIQNSLESIIERIEYLEAVDAEPPADDFQSLSAAVERLTALTARQTEPEVIQNLGQPPITSGDMTEPLERMQNAWDWVFGAPGAELPPPELRNTLNLYRVITGDGELTGRFNERAALAAANVTTLADMAVNAMNKVIVDKYNRLAVYRWFEQIVMVQPTDGSLHDMAWIQFGGFGNLPVIADGGAYSELEPADTKETSAFAKYGGYVGVTEKLIRNSAIAKLRAIPRELVVSAVQTRSAAIAGIFTQASGTGPTLAQDSTVLFHADHGNVATTSYSWAAWQAARLECFKQTELGSGKRQGLWPRFWLGPADLYDGALMDFGYGAGPGGAPDVETNDVNPYGVSRPGDPRPIPLAVPEFTDATDWAYIADPEISPIIQMSYADNPSGGSHPAPQLLAVISPTAGLMFTNDTMPIRVKDQWAYGVATYRGIGKRNVAG